MKRRTFLQAPALAFGWTSAGANQGRQANPGQPVTVRPQPQVVADPYVRVAKSPNDWKEGPWIGSPSIVKTASGRLLVCHDLFGTNSTYDTAYVIGSDDQGRTWTPLAELRSMFWPSLVRCASGLYVIGVDRQYERPPNHLVIARSEDNGRRWSKPSPLTPAGMAVHTANKGALVSNGKITYSFEVCPSLFDPPPQTKTAEAVSVAEEELDERAFRISVENAGVLVAHTLVAVTAGEQKLHCRVLEADKRGNRLVLRPERWIPEKAYPASPVNSAGPWRFPPGALVKAVSGTMGNHRDLWVMAMDAPETADLCDPRVWRISNPVGNPAYTHAATLKELFGFTFRAPSKAWLEGVLVRLEHPGGSGQIVNILRTGNGIASNVAARVIVDGASEQLHCRFDRFTFDPGLGCTHCYILYDSATKLYWMASNVNRGGRPASKGTRSTEPARERTALGLFYSINCSDWFMAGLVAYSSDMVHSYQYPHFIVDGEDLLLVSRSHVESPLTEETAGGGKANAHNANGATLHCVRNFRRLANMDFIHYGAAT
jgi:hypothetical protein